MRRALMGLVLCMAAAACGDSGTAAPDAAPQSMPDAGPAAPPTFHDTVEDLIRNHTNATEAPRPIDFDQTDDGKGFDDLLP